MAKIKLTAFNIKNFRSIIQSGWRSFASDNITILIGQNESGKTSVLEALNSFYTASLNEDVLRSDQTYPEISCNFSFEDNTRITDFLDKKRIPKGLKELLDEESGFILTRQWNDERSNSLYISSENIFNFFDKNTKEESKIEQETRANIELLLKEAEKLFSELEVCEKEKDDAQLNLVKKQKEVDDVKKLLRRAKRQDAKLIAEQKSESIQKEFLQTEEVFKQKTLLYEQVKQKIQEISEQVSICKAFHEASDRYNQLTLQKEALNKEVVDLEHLYGIISGSDKDKKIALQKFENTRDQLKFLDSNLKNATRQVKLQMLIAIKVFHQGLRFRKAESEAIRDLDARSKYYDVYELGEVLVNHIPIFEFFEDFGGLLPNRIDLEDVLNNNQNVEGYKAARNFLKIAGLSSEFFREKNHRILKQRIENLNGDITVNFQDYWSQNVGRNNKIRLHFELEHYDYTVPEKSGKPYLEFWIKDSAERLYPKQRSRGVRWFLSFYLELKATAAEKHVNRVMLIDEPGLSLHARAQEDVVKVFEDLKNSMQIIYCTHSPHLVQTEKLYRILAVQRAHDNDDSSESLIYEHAKLSNVTADTLTPIYALMGVRLNDQQFIHNKNNIIVPDTISYYYMKWLSKLDPALNSVHFIPSTSPESIPLLINILVGWHVHFGLLYFGSKEDEFYKKLISETMLHDSNVEQEQVFVVNSFKEIEDVFSTIDFKKYILQRREGITDKNSEFIALNGLSRKILATNFVNNFNGGIQWDNFDETTRKNLDCFFTGLKRLLKN